MQYIKAKFENSKRSYTYRTEDSVIAGDIVVDAKGSKLTVVDEPVDAVWIKVYGADKVAIVKKYEEPVVEYRIIDILDAKTKESRKDGRYPLRIGRIVKEPKPQIGLPMILEYLRNADGSDYSAYLRVSRVMEVREKLNVLEIETVNSIYIFEPVKAESKE